jgi:zinc transport system ATP-binding protein
MMSSGENALLQLQGIALEINGRLLLDNISLTLNPGEILTVIGPNGAGKTTLLRVALGLLKQTQGQVKRRAGLKIGYMPQRLAIDSTFPLTVKRFLQLGCDGDMKRAMALLDEVGAASTISTPMQNLSGGETQRVLLARALVREPDMLVLDEPVQGVDVNGQTELYRLISNIRKDHDCSVLMVSHDLHLVMAATDRVLCLNRHICCTGTPEAVTSDPAYVELFGPQAATELAVYAHHPDQEHEDCEICNGVKIK